MAVFHNVGSRVEVARVLQDVTTFRSCFSRVSTVTVTASRVSA